MELLAMELKDIMAILIASMLVFLPFVILFNPKVVALWKHKNEDKKQGGKQENSMQDVNNTQNGKQEEQINNHEESTLQQPTKQVEEQKPNKNANYTVTSFKDEEDNNN